MSSIQRNMLQSRMPAKPRRGGAGGSRPRQATRADFVPKMWNEFFAERADIQVNDTNVFRVYFSKSPTASQPACGSSEVESQAQPSSPLLVLLHGGGYSALSWSHFSVEITKIIHCQCLAIDLRGHGDTTVDNENDLSAETLASDVASVVAHVDPDGRRPVMLIGHSMGGAICVHIAARELIPSLIGCVVIDVVEGTAMESLASMQSFLRSRPKTFRSISHAIEWSVLSGQIRNVESAAVSMPGQIVNGKTGKLATNDLPLSTTGFDTDEPAARFRMPMVANDSTILEDAVDDGNAATECSVPLATDTTNVVEQTQYVWRINLGNTEPYWAGWFEGLSNKFLNLSVPKLLVLANINGLDRALTVGQMQGRFQLQVLARSGHVVHEDQPHEVADLVGTYLVRNRFAAAIE